VVDRRREAGLGLLAVLGREQLGPAGGRVRRDPHGEETAGEPRVKRAGEIEMAACAALKEAPRTAPGRVVLRLVEGEQDVVMAIQDLQGGVRR